MRRGWLMALLVLAACGKLDDAAEAPVALAEEQARGEGQRAAQPVGNEAAVVDAPAAPAPVVSKNDEGKDRAPRAQTLVVLDEEPAEEVAAPPPDVGEIALGRRQTGEEGVMGRKDKAGYLEQDADRDEAQADLLDDDAEDTGLAKAMPAPPPVALAEASVEAKEEAKAPDPAKPAFYFAQDAVGGDLLSGLDVAPSQDAAARSGKLVNGVDGTLDRRGRRPIDPGLVDDGWFARTAADGKPARFLPRMFYFENTYQGRSAAFLERLRRLDAGYAGRERPYLDATLPQQPMDPPEDKGLSLAVSLDRQWIDQPGRVYLQVALQGSQRYGWRRPPLDVVVVVDGAAVTRRAEGVMTGLQRLLATLGPQDRLGVVLAGGVPVVLAELGDLRDTRQALNRLAGRVHVADGSPAAGMELAGRLLQAASQGQARVPGSQTVLVLTGGDPEHVAEAAPVAHDLTVQGATTSVFDLSGGSDWWPVANAGHGNLHPVHGDFAAAIDDELARISQVIARLLRVNVRLAPDVHAIRVLGSRVLEADEVKAVKAREEATDRQLSATLGVKADRGEDDDGVQTVIPFFYGGDTHVILVELWVEKPGPVAEVSLRYKDMVALDNATAHAGARIGSVPRATTGADLAVRRSVRGFLLAEALDEAGRLVARGQADGARALLADVAADDPADQRMVAAFRRQLGSAPAPLVRDALEYASRRRISHAVLR